MGLLSHILWVLNIKDQSHDNQKMSPANNVSDCSNSVEDVHACSFLKLSRTLLGSLMIPWPLTCMPYAARFQPHCKPCPKDSHFLKTLLIIPCRSASFACSCCCAVLLSSSVSNFSPFLLIMKTRWIMLAQLRWALWSQHKLLLDSL